MAYWGGARVEQGASLESQVTQRLAVMVACSQGGGREAAVEFSLVSEHILLYKQWILCYLSSTFLKTQLPCYGGTDDESLPQRGARVRAPSRGGPDSLFWFSGLGPRWLWAVAPCASVLLLSWPASRAWQRVGGQSCFSVLRFYLSLCFPRYSRRKLEVYESG